jgi:UDP-glucose 4-epimerase
MDTQVIDYKEEADTRLMRVLITGGAGFIGSHVANRLLDKGHDVCCVDTLTTGRKENIDPRARFVEIDICAHSFHQLYDEFQPDLVVHAAASYKDPNDHWPDARTNVLGCVQVARLAKQHQTKRVVYFQTALCYGLNPPSPVVTEQKLSPWDSSYAMSKTAGEQYLLMADIPLTVFRLAHICGPRNISGPIPTFFTRITAGEPCKITDARRDFVHVGDLVDLIEKVAAGRAPGTLRQIYHVSSGKDWPILAIYHFVAQAMGKMDGPLEILPGGADDAKTILLDSIDTQRQFKWTPQVKVKDSIAEAVKWYRENGVGETYTHLRSAK